MIQLTRSTLLADVNTSRSSKKQIDFSQPIVNVGKLGIGRKTLIGNSKEYLDKAHNGKTSASVGSDYVIEKSVTKVDDTIYSESHAISKKVVSSFGKAVGLVVTGGMIIGPPVVGYILFDWIGFAVGSIIAAPFVMMFVWALVS